MSQSELNLLTFIVAATGALTGIASLGWNVIPYVTAGAKIYVEIKYVAEIQKEGGFRPVFEVNAYNKRRGPVQVRRWGIRTYDPPSARRFTTVLLTHQGDSGDELPKTIEGGHGASWRIYASELAVFEKNMHERIKIIGVVELGNDKEKKSKTLKLPRLVLQQRLVTPGPAGVVRLAGAGLAVAPPA